MNIKPILFNTDMVRAILDGRKTVTRRVIKPQPESKLRYIIAGSECGKWYIHNNFNKYWTPPYHAGDILYVRETWQIIPCIECVQDEFGICHSKKVEHEDRNSITEGCFVFEEDYPCADRMNWRPSIHMPKEAARIFLKVTNVRAERLLDIRYMDCIHEGVPYKQIEGDVISEFSKVWNSTIKKSDIDIYGWNADPWVWVIEFERCEKPGGLEK